MASTRSAAAGSRSTVRSTAFRKCLAESPKLDLGLVGFGELLGQLVDFVADFAEEIKIQTASIKQVLDIDENSVQVLFMKEFLASKKCPVTKFLDPLDE